MEILKLKFYYKVYAANIMRQKLIGRDVFGYGRGAQVVNLSAIKHVINGSATIEM